MGWLQLGYVGLDGYSRLIYNILADTSSSKTDSSTYHASFNFCKNGVGLPLATVKQVG